MSKNPRPLKPHRKALKQMSCCESRERKPGSCCCKWENPGNCLIMLSILILEPVRILPLLVLLRGFSRALFCWFAGGFFPIYEPELLYLFCHCFVPAHFTSLFHSFFQIKPPSWIFVNWQFETDFISGLV